MINPNTVGRTQSQILYILRLHREDETLYSQKIKSHLKDHFNQQIQLGSLFVTLSRLEDRGLVHSVIGEPENRKGGRAKRYYQITEDGEKVVSELFDNAPIPPHMRSA